jgi:hypothetical protein
MNDNDIILTEKEAAAFLKIAPQSLRCQRCHGAKPDGIPMIPFIRIGRSVRYCKSDLLAVVQAGRIDAA